MLSWKLCYKVVIHLSSHTGNFFATLVTRVTRKGWGLAPPSLCSWRISTSRNAPLRQGERSGMRRSLCSPNAPRMFLPPVPLWRTVRNRSAVMLASVSCLSLSSRYALGLSLNTHNYTTRVLHSQVIRQTFCVTLDIRTNVRKQKQAHK